MFDYGMVFRSYCGKNGLELRLSHEMPPGYETANGTFDPVTGTLYINAESLEGAEDCEKAFYLFHELRHAEQHIRPERFGEDIRRSMRYVIMFDGTCFKLSGGEYLECRLDGPTVPFTDLYLGQPYETDANTFAYEKTMEMYGESEKLCELYGFWMPRRPIPDGTYDEVYRMIDRKTGSQEG